MSSKRNAREANNGSGNVLARAHGQNRARRVLRMLPYALVRFPSVPVWPLLACLVAGSMSPSTAAAGKKKAVKPVAPAETTATAPTAPTPAVTSNPSAYTTSAPAPKTPMVAPSLTEMEQIGVEMERDARLPLAERGPALEGLSARMNQCLKKADGREKTAAQFLSGDIRFRAGDRTRALEMYRRAEKDGGRFADDAGFAAVLALEGHDGDAAAQSAWLDWEKRYPRSPLRGEALLARTWNALRRESLDEAKRLMDQMDRAHPELAVDPRRKLAQATWSYLKGNPQEALAALEGTPRGAAETYLSALCLQAKGDVLKAAAKFQDVAERYPDSPLRDGALLAKANAFLTGKAFPSAAEEYARVVQKAGDPKVQAEAELRQGTATVLAGDPGKGAELLAGVVERHPRTGVAARAQFLLGDVRYHQKEYDAAIVEFNRVLTQYFEDDLASIAQYRVGQCLDALGRHPEATSAYQAVVSGYPQSSESPAAAYMAGVGLLDQNRAQASVPYFQLVLDKYAGRDTSGAVVFAAPEHRELVEAALCFLCFAYHKSGNLGELSGMPHLMLQKMPPSASPWRGYALLIDADALASQGRYPEATAMLENLRKELPDHPVTIHASRLLAWTYAKEGRPEDAIAIEQAMLARYAAQNDSRFLAGAYLNKAHVLFNQKSYKQAAAAYEDFLARFPDHPDKLLALYQAGLTYFRLNRSGDAVDRWELLVSIDPKAPIAEKAWLRAGDLYFQAEHYDNAKRAYTGLMENFTESDAASMAMLKLAQCEYNAGHDAEALDRFSQVTARFPGTPTAQEAERGIQLALYRLGQNANGADVLEQLVQKYPQSSFAGDALFQMAMHHYESKEYPEAAAGFRRVITEFPGYASADRAYFLLGDATQSAGDTASAIAATEQFLQFFPQSELRAAGRFRLGSMRFASGDYLRAAVEFTALLEEPDVKDMAAPALYNLALCQRLIGQTAEAKASFEKYREQHPGDDRAPEIAYQLGDLHAQAGEKDQATAEWEKALASRPTPARAAELHYRLGLSREDAGDLEAALRSYRRAIEGGETTDPYRLSALAHAAAIYEKQGQVEKALAAYRDLIRHANDPELVSAAEARANQLKSGNR
jgi:TolA-binding protein